MKTKSLLVTLAAALMLCIVLAVPGTDRKSTRLNSSH